MAHSRTDQHHILFALDIDENIVSTKLRGGELFHGLSDGAQTIDAPHSIAHESNTIRDVHLISNEFGNMLFEQVNAFRRRKWAAFFNKIRILNERYHAITGDKVLLINCMFLTNAKYNAQLFINNVFDVFFTKEQREKIMPNPLFVNSLDQQRVIEQAHSRPGSYQYIQGIQQGAHHPEHRSLITTKSKFMAVEYPTLSQRFGIANPRNIILIDDNRDNCTSMLYENFSAIHHPSDSLWYKTEGEKTFVDMDAHLSKAEHYIKTLGTEVEIKSNTVAPDLSNRESKNPNIESKKIIVRTRAGITAFLSHIQDEKEATKEKLITLLHSYCLLPQKRNWFGRMFSTYDKTNKVPAVQKLLNVLENRKTERFDSLSLGAFVDSERSLLRSIILKFIHLPALASLKKAIELDFKHTKNSEKRIYPGYSR
jgi:hypothetical protein